MGLKIKPEMAQLHLQNEYIESSEDICNPEFDVEGHEDDSDEGLDMIKQSSISIKQNKQ